MSDIDFKTNDSYISEDFVVDVPIRCWHTETLDGLDNLTRRRERTVRKTTETIQHMMFEFHLNTGDAIVAGPEGSANRIFTYINEIWVDLSVLLDILQESVGIVDGSARVFVEDSIQESIEVTIKQSHSSFYYDCGNHGRKNL